MFYAFNFMHQRWGSFGRPQGAFERGALKFVILDLLQDKPAHGYELIRALEERSHGFYTPSAGSIYPTLQLLTDMGYVTAVEADGKKVYTITDSGRAYLKENHEIIDRIHSFTQERWPGETKTFLRETFGELHELGHLFRSHFRDLSDEQMKRIDQVIKQSAADIRKIINEKA